MRMFAWTPDMVRLMRDACELTDFHDALADEIVAALGGSSALDGKERVAPLHICDAGCGLGYLSLALASRCAHVTAVDVSAPALDVLVQNISTRGINNITPQLGSIFDLTAGARFDCMVFCLFGQIDEALRAARGRCDWMVLVKRSRLRHRFALDADNGDGQPPCVDGLNNVKRLCNDSRQPSHAEDALTDTLQRLESLEAPFDIRRITLSLDQPFRTFSDATLFFRVYGKSDITSEPDEHEVMRRLVSVPNAKFPWLLKAERELAVITVDLRRI